MRKKSKTFLLSPDSASEVEKHKPQFEFVIQLIEDAVRRNIKTPLPYVERGSKKELVNKAFALPVHIIDIANSWGNASFFLDALILRYRIEHGLVAPRESKPVTLKELRKSLGLSQALLAEQIGVSGLTVQQIEYGHKSLSCELANVISHAFSIPLHLIVHQDPKRNFAGDQVREMRVKHGLTQAELAAKLNVAQGFVAHLEGNVRPVTKAMAKKLATYFDIDPEYFVPKTTKEN